MFLEGRVLEITKTEDDLVGGKPVQREVRITEKNFSRLKEVHRAPRPTYQIKMADGTSGTVSAIKGKFVKFVFENVRSVFDLV